MMGLLGLTYRHTGRAPKRVTTVAATWTANSAAAARSAKAALAGRPPGVAGTAASHLLMKAPQKASPAPGHRGEAGVRRRGRGGVARRRGGGEAGRAGGGGAAAGGPPGG